jgi:hypothetical protein
MAEPEPQTPPPQLFSAVLKRRFGRSTCFLCGRRLGKKNRSDEHVFPKWLQERFDLWNKQLTLLNGTTILYRHLKIPCCLKCNGTHLKPIEDAVCKAVEAGAKALSALPELTLFLWLGKILYGLLYREYLLPLDRRSKSKRPIVPKSLLQTLEMHHYLLQGSRVPVRFLSFFPASITVVRTQQPRRVQHQFDFRDSPIGLTLAIRMGKVGILAALQDGGAIQMLPMPKYRRIALHPIQFQELAAQFFYKASLMNRTPKFMLVEQAGVIHVLQAPLGGLSALPIFDDWNPEHYAHVLSLFIRIPVEHLYYPPKVMTFLRNTDGRLKFIDVNADPEFA